MVLVNDFTVISRLGKGGFGTVYLVKKKTDPYQVNYAMKVIEKKFIFEQNYLRRVIAERNILIQMNNPFIVKLSYAFQSPSRLYFVM